jgi:hypothetical protein
MKSGFRRSSLSFALVGALILLPSSLLAQSATPAAPPQHHEMAKPTNLQVLPKDISMKDLLATMHQFQGALGVRCSFCHEQNAQTHHIDFASDAKPEKAAARVMMRMTADLNEKYLTQLPDKGDMMQVSCGTCHRGHSTPEEFKPEPEKERSSKK